MSGQAQQLTSGRAGSLPLVGGRLCLNFTNTTSGRGSDHHLEHLNHYGDVIVWAEPARILSADEAGLLARRADHDAAESQAALDLAITLREALHAIFLAQAEGRDAPPAAIEQFNRLLGRAMGQARLRAMAEGYAWDWHGAPSVLETVLWPIARSAAELLVSPALRRVKVCPGRHCGWLFLDTTKNGGRRWCEMRVCGSRAKARRHHHRKRKARPEGAIA